MMAVTAEAIGASQVWRGGRRLEGFTGRGIGVAVIDSGVAPHRALRGRIVASLDFTDPKGTGRDEFGHGTHVAGIIAGTDDAGYSGVAPERAHRQPAGARADGAGDTSDVIAAIDWVIAHNARVPAPRHQPIARPPGVRKLS